MSDFEEGTVIRGTMRHEDVIPAMMEELDSIKEQVSLNAWEGYEDIPHMTRVQAVGSIDDELGAIERRMKHADYFESEDADWDSEWLFETLNSWAPDDYYFGAHPGDGSDFGWWRHEDEDD